MINSISSVNFQGLHPYGTHDNTFTRNQGRGHYRDMVQRADELRQSKVREYSCGLISKGEFDRFMSASTDSIIRYMESPCCYI